MGRELVMASPDRIAFQPSLVRYANDIGAAAYRANCGLLPRCRPQGRPSQGRSQSDRQYLAVRFRAVSDIERTILYGIRAGLGKSHNVTDMPALAARRRSRPRKSPMSSFMCACSKGRKDGDADALKRGEAIFQDKGVCYDCHSRDGTAHFRLWRAHLTDDEWLYGGDDKTIYRSIYDGRHGVCPAWVGKLSFATIRALAVYVHSMSKESPFVPKGEPRQRSIRLRAPWIG